MKEGDPFYLADGEGDEAAAQAFVEKKAVPAHAPDVGMPTHASRLGITATRVAGGATQLIERAIGDNAIEARLIFERPQQQTDRSR